jgi:hypothetical protein
MLQPASRPVSRARARAGRVISALPCLFLLVDGVAKLMRIPPVMDGFTQLGYAPGVAIPIGLLLLGSLAVYVVPQTVVLGAILLTGYLGGAVATHVRVGSPLLTHVLFPVYLALLLWGGLYLREPRLAGLLPLRK